MTRFFKTAALSLVGVSLIASPALANETEQEVSIAFKYDEAASVEANYKELRREVRRACLTGNAIVSSVFDRAARRECRAQLMDRAVEASARPALIAMHTGDAAPRVAAVASR